MSIKGTHFQNWLLCVAVLQGVTAGAQTVTTVAAGSEYGLFLKSDGSLWGMGYNKLGQLGDGTYSTNAPYGTNRPEQIVASGVTAIAAAHEYHSLFLKSDGSLWGMGNNYFGELGEGTYNPTNRPEQIVASNVAAIAAGGLHSLFLKSDGGLWAMGWNPYGELGDGTYNWTGINVPEQIVASNVTAIAGGYEHSLFLKSDGSLWAMGYNVHGELGDGTYNQTNRPEQIVASNVTAIAAGGFDSLFLKNDGSLWAMGYNKYGQLGDGTYGAGPGSDTNRPEQIVASNVTAIAAGQEGHSLYLMSDGSLWAMGLNSNGQLGDGTNNNTNRPERIVASGVTAIAAGDFHSLFVKRDGSLWTMGDNYYGQLGDGTYNQTNLPEQIVAGVIAPPNIVSISLAGTNLILNGINGVSGTTNYVLMTTDVTLPRSQWTPLATDILSANGNFTLTLTNAVDPTARRRFYTLRCNKTGLIANFALLILCVTVGPVMQCGPLFMHGWVAEAMGAF
jgi:alpha-tubulin suppressor-like RCC1 family protein